ncbi:mannonate dehydratase [Chloroflexi bacterium TSY]|nr:mannonate dehydratase [Chloroflexi bacterium TSY]
MTINQVSKIQIGKGLGDVAEITLRFFRQIGVESVGMPTRYVTKSGTVPTTRPLVPPAQMGPAGSQPKVWDEEELRQIRQRIESFDLVPTMAALPLSANILLGRPERERDLEVVKACIEVAGKVGLKVLTYTFTALRASEGYGAQMGGGRGGANLRDFDYDRIHNLPSLPSVGEHSLDAMWERISHFLHEVIPTAEAAGVRLACHPNDPPIPIYRGVAQPVADLAGLRQLIEIIDSPANSIYFDTGVTTELGENAVDAIYYFGRRDRIGTVHFRNVRVETPYYKYVETFHDDGECNMLACMKAFHDVGYDGLIDPDHTPGISGDTADSRIGWAFAIGQMIALRAAAAAGV